MALILNIETAIEGSSICLADNGIILQEKRNELKNDNAAWIHEAIQEMMTQQQLQMKSLQAISVSAGPGSYTGLRIGMATAKGLSYALEIPLIAISTLELMAASILRLGLAENALNAFYLCPLIDARRMEVFYAVYDEKLEIVVPPAATILSENFLTKLLQEKSVYFFGNGSKKLKPDINHTHAQFIDFSHAVAADMVQLSQQYYDKTQFVDLAYTQPMYIKEFYSTQKNNVVGN